ncbi:MAG: homoserine kinase [Clostridia bacterium]|nr:homoserine kinase [Clostridia bacterium]
MVQIKAGATSANIGPGFDCIGVALNLYNTVEIEESDDCVVISQNVRERADENNIFIKSARAVYDLCGKPFYGISVRQETKIPPARGLGSSSACIAAAICGANAILGDPLKKSDLIDLAASLEGHPDNTTPCIAGGLCFCVYENGRVRYNRITLGRKLLFCALVPDFRMKTSKSRLLIPRRVSHEDAAYNVSRAAYLASAFYARDYAALGYALSDRLHQPYRLPHIEGADTVIAVLNEFSPYGVYLSGAGPTIMAVADAENRDFVKNVRASLKEKGINWRALALFSDAHGIRITNK